MPLVDEELPKCIPWAFRDLFMEYGEKDPIDYGIAREIKEDTATCLNEPVNGFYENADAEQLAVVFFWQ